MSGADACPDVAARFQEADTSWPSLVSQLFAVLAQRERIALRRKARGRRKRRLARKKARGHAV